MSNDKKSPLKRKKRKKGIMGYIYLFAIVFIITLSALSYLVKSYSPDVDVEIGNKEALTLGDEYIDTEIRPIDERLKWIQQEDEMPSITMREPKIKEHQENNDITEDTEIQNTSKPKTVIPLPEKPSTLGKHNENTESEVKQSKKKQVIPAPIPTLTKVYIGGYSSLEDAMAMQQKVASDTPEAMPFVKSVNNKYIVQLGSFTKKETADSLIQKLREKGYNPKILNEN